MSHYHRCLIAALIIGGILPVGDRRSYGLKASVTEQDDWLPRSAIILQGCTPTLGEAPATDVAAAYTFGWELPNRWRLDTSMRYGTEHAYSASMQLHAAVRHSLHATPRLHDATLPPEPVVIPTAVQPDSIPDVWYSWTPRRVDRVAACKRHIGRTVAARRKMRTADLVVVGFDRGMFIGFEHLQNL